MQIIKTTPEFDDWLAGLKDRVTRTRLANRLDKVRRGQLGDVKSVGEGIFEMREHFGPGWRMYYVHKGSVLIVMLGGGDKSTQATDIVKAEKIAASLEE
jgi:putative addiction module killer protein